MVLVSYSGKEINAKLVYYGPGLSGKTTNLEYIYGSIPQTHRGKMVSMKTKTERTLFFDFLPVNLGELAGFKTRFLLYTVPGQVYYNATRKLVLKGVDAVVFVADSKRGKMDENVESLENLKENLREHGLQLEAVPWVLQYNKRDLPDVYTIEELNQVLNPARVPTFEAVAMSGQGVVDTFRAVSKLLLRKLSKEIGVPVASVKPGGTNASAPELAESKDARLDPLTGAPPAASAVSPAISPAASVPAASASPPTASPAALQPLATDLGPGGSGSASPNAPMFESQAFNSETRAFDGGPSNAPSFGFTRGADSFGDSTSGAAGEAGPSVGERLRRWLGKKESDAQEPNDAAPQALGPEAAVPSITPALTLAARGQSSGAGPREIVVLVDIESEDLDRGIVLKLEFKQRAERRAA